MMRTSSLVSIGFALLLLGYGLAGCAKPEAKSAVVAQQAAANLGGEAAKPAEAPPTDQATFKLTAKTDPDPGPLDEHKLIRTGTLRLQVDAYDPARDHAEAIVRAAGGYIASVQVDHQEGRVSSATLIVRVPSAAWPDVLARLRGEGQVLAEAVSAEDITEQYVDLEARLANARTLETRLLEMASTKTGTVADLLQVEEQLSRVRGEIEEMEGRLRLWDHQVAFSALTLALTTRAPEIAAAPATGFGGRARAQLGHSIASLRELGEGILLGGVAIAPWLPLVVACLFVARRLLRRAITRPVA
jgi:hypothetical protein